MSDSPPHNPFSAQSYDDDPNWDINIDSSESNVQSSEEVRESTTVPPPSPNPFRQSGEQANRPSIIVPTPPNVAPITQRRGTANPLVGRQMSSDLLDLGPRSINYQDPNSCFLTNTARTVNPANVIREIASWNFGVIDQRKLELDQILKPYVIYGSKAHNLLSEDITVYANADHHYLGKEVMKVTHVGSYIVPETLEGLMANGTKFFDGSIYLSLKPEFRPMPLPPLLSQEKAGKQEIMLRNEKGKLISYLYTIYFYIIIRARVPSTAEAYKSLPMPKFITSILGVKDSLFDIVEYVSEFDLTKLDLQWVKKIDTTGMSRESLMRLGLGVAGYRIISIFNAYEPDRYDSNGIEREDANDKDEKETTERHSKLFATLNARSQGKTAEEREKIQKELIDERRLRRKPVWLDDAVAVARSFRDAGYCWDFHPATRNLVVIERYGKINKNAINLIVECYKTKTIETMLKTKKLAQRPIYDPSYREYQRWDKTKIYLATSPIFKKK